MVPEFNDLKVKKDKRDKHQT